MKQSWSFDTLDALLSEFLDLKLDERPAFLQRLTAEQPEMAAPLTRLLNHLEESESFLDQDAERARDTLLADSLESLHSSHSSGELPKGHQLGPYQVERVIGQGLSASVYLATRQDDEWSQQVAIKVMARGVNTDDVLRRFLSERQILTELRYPGICTLLDGGVTNEGMPYFVMEFIDGQPITDYCRTHSLSLAERVTLFRQVCRAVSQAHRHLVVHRDIKPANILVTEEGQAKLLDFGIAKLLEPQQIDSLPLTLLDARPMTPAYSSPEQISGGPVTMATDVYQLGLLLVEVLTGVASPRESMGIKTGLQPAETMSLLTEINGDELPYAQNELSGDLDWIVFKALEPIPADRYGSAAELVEDLDRFLENRPVSARQATLPYQARKFVRRRPGLSLAGVLTILAVIGYIALLGYYNANMARERAAALESAARAEEVKDLMIRFISSPDPYSGSGADTQVSDLLEDSEAILMDEFQHRPELQAELFRTLADVYQGLDIPEQAISLRQRELTALRRLQGDQSLAILQARGKLAVSRSATGDATDALTELEIVQREIETKHPEAWLLLATVIRQISEMHTSHGRRLDAELYAQHAVSILEVHDEAPLELASSLVQLGYVSEDQEVRLAYQQRAYELFSEHHGPTNPVTLVAWIGVAATLTNLQRYSESLAIYSELIPLLESEFGPLHNQTLTGLNNIAFTFQSAGDYEAAIPIHLKVLARKRQKLGSNHREIGNSQQNLGALLNRMGRYEEAIAALTEAAEIFAEVNLPGSHATAYPHITLADIYGKQNLIELLEQHARHAIGLLEGNVSETHPALLKSRCLLGDALIRQGQLAEGTRLLESAIASLDGQANAPAFLLRECRAGLDSTLDS